MKKIFAVLLICLMFAVFAASCSCGGSAPTQTPTEAETEKADEAAPDGGKIELDADGNVITKDPNGGITSVRDKSGNELDVEEYIQKHPLSSSDSQSTASKTSGSKTTSSKQSSNTSSNTSSKTSSKTSSSKSSDGLESALPNVVADVNDDEDKMINLDDII